MVIIDERVLPKLLTLNETEIRFHIVDPVLRALGYPGGDDIFFKLEEKLEYPYFHIGHKSKKRDQPLGFPDYRAGLKGRRGSFVLEAKAGHLLISKADVEQAHSYAAHAQVGANYFVLCDGSFFSIYHTLSGSSCRPIVKIPIVDISLRFHEIENILSPDSLERNCRVKHDVNKKLCDGLGSSAIIKSGCYGMSNWTLRIFVDGNDCTELLRETVPEIKNTFEQLEMLQKEFELKVAEGIAQREADGRITATVMFSGITKGNQAAMKLLGLERVNFSTDDESISNKSENPTVFESVGGFSVSKGTLVTPFFGDAIEMGTDLNGDIFISARMYKSGDRIVGDYAAFANYDYGVTAFGNISAEMDLYGDFDLRLIL